jgi:drug/metabolite transporter (DMT)-like permease
VQQINTSAVDRPVIGILLMLGAGIVFSMADAISKVLAETLPLAEITWLRWSGLVAVVLPALISSGGRSMHSVAPLLQIFRSLSLVGSSFFFVWGLSNLPLASAVAISFVSPAFVTALSIPILSEQVGIRRWAAIFVGLGGVLVIIRPGSDTFQLAALFPLLSSICWAVAVVTTRKLGHGDPPWTAMAYTGLVGFGFMSLFMPAIFTVPTGRELLIGAAMAFFAFIGQFLTLMAFRRAPASILAPFSYVQLVWSTGLGYLIFGSLPDAWTWLGAGIIISSGGYMGHRERIRRREAAHPSG